MSCDFCRSTPVAVCPMCSPNLTMTPRPMRSAKKAKTAPRIGRSVTPPVQAPKVAVWAINPSGPVPLTGFAPGGTLGSRSTADRIADNERQMRAISAQLVAKAEAAAKALEARQSVEAVPAPVPTAPMPIATPAPRPAPRAATMTPVVFSDWHAAARFTLAMMRKPTLLVDSTCKVVDPQAIQPGNWLALSTEVEAGRMSHAQAVAMASAWPVGVRS